MAALSSYYVGYLISEDPGVITDGDILSYVQPEITAGP